MYKSFYFQLCFDIVKPLLKPFISLQSLLGISSYPQPYLEEICQSMIFLKMVIMESSSNSLMVIMLKCLRKRGVTGFLPPPGGPMAAMIWMSINFMGVVSFRSYQFQWSNHCLSNSIGGWAPNCSNMGMFKSSTNTIYNNKQFP